MIDRVCGPVIFHVANRLKWSMDGKDVNQIKIDGYKKHWCDQVHVESHHHHQVPVGPHHHHRGRRLLAFPLLLRHCRQKGRTDAEVNVITMWIHFFYEDNVIVMIMMIRGVHHPVWTCCQKVRKNSKIVTWDGGIDHINSKIFPKFPKDEKLDPIKRDRFSNH